MSNEIIGKFKKEIKKQWSKAALGLLAISLTACAVVEGRINTQVANGVNSVRTEMAPTLEQMADVVAQLSATPTETSTPTKTASATSTNTEIPSPTATATRTATATSTPLGGIAGCEPLNTADVAEFAPVDTNGNLVPNDRRDAWNLLDSDLVLTRRKVDMIGALNCFALQAGDAYSRGFFKEGHITTYEKFAEMLGIDPSQLANRLNVDINFVHRDDVHTSPRILGESLSKPELTGIITSGEHLSQSFVELAEQLSILGRKLRPNGEVVSPEQIARQLVDTYNLEGLWRPGIKPENVDELDRNCMTNRTVVVSPDRLDQGEGLVFVRHEEHIVPGQEVLAGEVYELSNKDGLLVVVNVVTSEAEFNEVQKALDENDHYATVINISGDVKAFLQVFDLRNEEPNTDEVRNAPNAKKVGSGNQLVPCGRVQVINSLSTIPAPTRVFVPTYGTPIPEVSPTVPQPTGTEPVATVVTPPVPTRTDAPTQPPQPERTQGPTPTNYPTPTWTAAPERTPEQPVPTPTQVPAATNTPLAVNGMIFSAN